MKQPPYQELIGALRAIAMLGGNLPDDRLTDRTGPNDAAHRGLMYTQARRYAADMLTKAGYRINEHGEWVKDL